MAPTHETPVAASAGNRAGVSKDFPASDHPRHDHAMLTTLRPCRVDFCLRVRFSVLLPRASRWCRVVALIVGLVGVTSLAELAARAESVTLKAVPNRVGLESPEASDQIVILAQIGGGGALDVTREATYEIAEPDLITISPTGRMFPQQDGETRVRVRWREAMTTIEVRVTGLAEPPPVSFQRDVIPILSKAGCNSGGCHGKAEGQQGFKLSVFGYNAAADYQALTQEGRGRRIFPAAPANSLLIRKATAQVPHGGGRKVEPGSRWERLLLRWLHEGARFDNATASSEPLNPAESVLTVEPAEVTLASRGTQQLRVSLLGQDGVRRCVTAEADFQSNQDAVASVDSNGIVTASDVPGEAGILVRYMGHVAVCRVTRPRDDGSFNRPPERNFIDRLVWDKLQLLRVAPSPIADDATFLRRAYLDTIGTLPTADEARRFLADTTSDKRARLVAELLDRPEYADYWAQRWSDLLQVDKDTITPQSAIAMTRWIHGQFRDNVPFDVFARAVLTAQGSTLSTSPAAFFQVQSDPEKAGRAISQLFLGVRIECAQCHHHPFERWDQKDYLALSAFFTGIERKANPLGGLKIVSSAGTDLQHPRTGEMVRPAGLGAQPPDLAPGQDRRVVFADWASSADNPYFARTIANRLWAHYLGRGLVEPIDDLRATNPASNEPLLDALAKHMVDVQFDLKAFTRTLLGSQVYQLSVEVNESNRLDEQNYSHASWKPLPAEVLLDAVSQVTGVPEEFNGWPKGFRAIQIWDNKLPSHFLEVFGRPRRLTVCACERGVEPSMAQALHLLNAPGTNAKIQDREGRVARLAASTQTDEQIIQELYLSTLSRFPSDQELTVMRQHFAATPARREAVEDLLWTLLNTREFVFNH